jgi:hypothetical protein
MILISPIDVPTKGTGKIFEIEVIRSSVNASSTATPTFYWSVKTEIIEAPQESDEQPIKRVGPSVLEGNLQMTSEEYSLWAADDNYVIDWALEKLQFTRI